MKPFKNTCTEEQKKDYTALLLNCYIKQKQPKKLRDFVDEQNINDALSIKTAIEVCKDTKEIDLALLIAQKANMIESYIQILMDMKGDYAESLDYLKGVKDIIQRFNLILKYGGKFLEKNPKEANNVITSLIREIIAVRNGNSSATLTEEEIQKIKELKYEQIISIYNLNDIKEENQKTEDSSINLREKLTDILDEIMREEKKCPSSIVNRRIELYIDQINTPHAKTSDIYNKIRDILNDKKFENVLDKYYILMLFKVSKFSLGIEELTEKMNLEAELCQIYMDNHDYPKIFQFCEKHGKDNANYYIQALNFLFSNSKAATKKYITEWIQKILNLMVEQDKFNPMTLLEIAQKAQEKKDVCVDFSAIKPFIMKWIKVQQKSLKEDIQATEKNSAEIEKTENTIKELTTKAKTFSIPKCSNCNKSLSSPFVYFACGHGYHQDCLNFDEYEDNTCTICSQRETLLKNRHESSLMKAIDIESFKQELTAEKKKKFNFFAKSLGSGIFLTLEEKIKAEALKNQQGGEVNNYNNLIGQDGF